MRHLKRNDAYEQQPAMFSFKEKPSDVVRNEASGSVDNNFTLHQLPSVVHSNSVKGHAVQARESESRWQYHVRSQMTQRRSILWIMIASTATAVPKEELEEKTTTCNST